MTRVKKTRSLKRIHSVKTGSKSKLKKQLGTDRQGSKQMKGRRVLSAYEKFLLDNPQANEAAKSEQQALQRKAELAKEKAQTNKEQEAIITQETTKKESRKTLLDQLEDRNLDNLY